ncbi:MAG: FAD-dependent oxidoreductase [Niameybacter sp.]|uniref:phytoene desaturase family protein n=1 Tax=Niameybacter sp. TaxID=2033640 RepID=UPI002FC66170
MNYDVVIIGGGLAGLAAGLKLTNDGKKVVILEKHHMAGGYATNFKRKDKEGHFYTFDTALHGIGGMREGNAFNLYLEELGILSKIKLLEKPETATVRTLEGEENDIPSNFEDYKKYLTQRYPSEKENIKRLFSFLMDVKEDMVEVYKSSTRMPKYNTYLESITLYDFLKTYTQHEELIEAFSFLWLYYGLPPQKLNALYYILPWISYHIGGTYYIEGGAGKLSDTFKEMIEAKGSKVQCSSEVVKIETSGQEIVSVTTKKGETFYANQFIIACDPTPIFEMIEEQTQEVRLYKERLESLEKGISLTQLYIGLDCASRELGMSKGDYFIEVTKHEETYKAIKSGDYEQMSFGITCYDTLDPKLNGAGQGVVAIIVGDTIDNWPAYKSEAYQARKLEVTKKLIEKAERIFPHLSQHIKVMELGTPCTMKRYTNNSQGAVYGWEQSVGQGGFKRVSFKTPLHNALLAGAWSNPGGGFEGAIVSGVMCAQRMLRTSTIPKVEQTHTVTEPPMALPIFMAGMAANVDRKKAKDAHIVYAFQFDNAGSYYLQVKKGKGKLLKEAPSQIDVVIHTSYLIWYQIAFEGRSGAAALFDGEIRVEGDVESFMKIQELFDTQSLSGKEETEEKSKMNTIIWVNLALLPWIIYWIVGAYVQPLSLTLLTTLYIVAFISWVKPRKHKELTSLEGLALVTFMLYGVLSIGDTHIYQQVAPYLVDGFLIAGFLISILMQKPMTMSYSKIEYNKEMVKTKLFLNINKTLSSIWVIVFTLQFITKDLLPSPMENIAYVFIIIGLVLSYIYPKKILQQ